MPACVAVSNHAAVFSQYHKVTLTDECGITHATNIPRCHFRANACGVPSNPEGAPVGGISALMYGIVQPSASNIHPKRNDPRVVPRLPSTNRARSRTLQKRPTSQTNKNFPHIPAISKKRIKFSLRKWRGYGGSSGRVREVWRVGDPLRKRVPCASKVFPFPPRSFLYPNTGYPAAVCAAIRSSQRETISSVES